jgi:hypothetical protein
MPDVPRAAAAAEGLPRLRPRVLPHGGGPVRHGVLLYAVLGQGAQAPGAAEEGGCVMARKRSGLEQVRRDMYLGQRTIGDFQAAQRGPATLGKRLVRRDLTRAFFRALRQFGK